jgi:hypothetical protein
VATGGWKTQPLPLKLLLPVSVVLVVLGVLRCSSELTPVDAPGTIKVERAAVEIPDSLSALPPDSLSLLTARLFARGLRDVSDATVTLQEDREAWAIVHLWLRESEGGRVELGAAATSVATRRPLASAAVTDSLYRLREASAEAARVIAGKLNLARGADGKAETSSAAPESSASGGR